uniref:S-antigen; retina and pineal gland (arrestin) a n=1 Tax=Scleropages formosus TaxID=113540 RepID=A0A8C9SRK0_SCLFO
MSTKQVVFKKLSRDKSVGIYMGKRDFVDHCDFVEPVDGVVIVDPKLLQGKKAFVVLCCTFRYGRDDDDNVLASSSAGSCTGAASRRSCCTSWAATLTPSSSRWGWGHWGAWLWCVAHVNLCVLYPTHQFPDNLPCSVQPAPTDVGKKCAVEFEVKAFCAKGHDDKVQKRSSVSLAIRKVQYAPERGGAPPSVELSREFGASEKALHVEACLEKQGTYYHGEPIGVHVNISNGSSKTVKNIIVMVEQVANVVLYSNDSYAETVATVETPDTVESGASLQATYTILPLLANNRKQRGIALDGKLKHEDTNLASSSIVKDGVLPEVLGILVSYRLLVKLVVGGSV